MKQINHNIVLIADRVYDDDFDLSGNELEKIGNQYFESLFNSLSKITLQLTHYNEPKDFIKNIEKHKNDIVFTVYGGCQSRNRMALIPAICESYNIKYVGADTYARIICQDKQVSKEIAKDFQIKTAKYLLIRKPENFDLISTLKLPLVVKPLYEGSSIGIDSNSLCRDYNSAKTKAITLLSQFKQPVLMEEFISGKELVGCFIGNNDKIILKEFVEVVSPENENYFLSNLFTAENKHTEKIPFIHRKICDDMLIKEMPKLIDLFLSLGKMDFMRIDGRLTDDGFYLIELTPDAYIGDDCSFADIYNSIGKSYEELLYDIINAALSNY